jgi:uncharacterized membrane protein (DUF485 family)
MKLVKHKNGFFIHNKKETKAHQAFSMCFVFILLVSFPLFLVGTYLLTKSICIAFLAVICTILPISAMVSMYIKNYEIEDCKAQTKEDILKEISEHLDKQ